MFSLLWFSIFFYGYVMEGVCCAAVSITCVGSKILFFKYGKCFHSYKLRNSAWRIFFCGNGIFIPFRFRLIKKVYSSDSFGIVFKSNKILCNIYRRLTRRYVMENIFWEYPYLNIIHTIGYRILIKKEISSHLCLLWNLLLTFANFCPLFTVSFRRYKINIL